MVHKFYYQKFIREHSIRMKYYASAFKGKHFIFFSNNCIAGFVYHDIKHIFESPTINTRIDCISYLNFLKDIEYYLSSELIEIKNYDWPAGIIYGRDKILNVVVQFLHSSSFYEAKKEWDRRKERCLSIFESCPIISVYCFDRSDASQITDNLINSYLNLDEKLHLEMMLPSDKRYSFLKDNRLAFAFTNQKIGRRYYDKCKFYKKLKLLYNVRNIR